MAGEPQIDRCPDQERREALTLMLRSLPANQRGPLIATLGRLADERLGPFDALVTAYEHRRLVGVAWAQPQPGGTATLWPPELDRIDPRRVSRPLVDEAMRRAEACGVQLTQTLLESPEGRVPDDLLACGFRYIAELEYQSWPRSRQTAGTERLSRGIELCPADEVGVGRLTSVVAETYVETLDCPELDGVRDLGTTLDGYAKTGDSGRSLWYVLSHGGADAGVLLLSEHKASRQLELIYLGVVPEFRGRRLGRAAVAEAQRIAVDRRCEQVVLAVDRRNKPAKAIYEHAGFTPWANRHVFLRVAPAADGLSP